MPTREKQPIEVRSLSEQVYQYLCDQIIEGRIKYGDVLNIKQLAQQLKVSTMPVREAIKRLEMEGLVTIKPRSTCIITIPTKKDILETVEMRELLEVFCVEKVYASVDQDDLHPLHEIVERMEHVAPLLLQDGAHDSPRFPLLLSEYIQLEHLYHTQLCRLANNSLVDKFYREINLKLNMHFIYDIAAPPDVARTYRDHRALLEALEQHSGEAVTIIREHLEQSRENIIKGRGFAQLPDE